MPVFDFKKVRWEAYKPSEKTKEETLAELRWGMTEVRLRNNGFSLWLLELEKSFLKAGGSQEEIKEIESCLSDALPKLRWYIHTHINNGGIKYKPRKDPCYIDRQIDFLMGGFTKSDFKKVEDRLVDSFFEPYQVLFSLTRHRQFEPNLSSAKKTKSVLGKLIAWLIGSD
jgi:hypothetical protein